MGNRDKLHTGELYLPNDPEVLEEQLRYMELLYEYNQTRPWEQERRQALLRELLAEVGEGCWIEPPFHANWGGHHVHFGRMVYANYGLTMVDDTHIYHVRTQCHRGHGGAPHPAGAAGAAVPVQHSCADRPQLLDWRGGNHPPRHHRRGQRGGRRRQCCDPRSAGQRGGGGKPLPGPAGGG